MDKEASVIIPAYNEETGVGPLLSRMQETGLLEKYEVIVIDDGSEDNTAEISKNMGNLMLK